MKALQRTRYWLLRSLAFLRTFVGLLLVGVTVAGAATADDYDATITGATRTWSAIAGSRTHGIALSLYYGDLIRSPGLNWIVSPAFESPPASNYPHYFAGFGYGSSEHIIKLGFFDSSPSARQFHQYALIPYWAVGIVGALMAAPTFVSWGRRRYRRRHGRCLACGYDLRATSDRCPECGCKPALPPE